jgi:hypothetical protein
MAAYSIDLRARVARACDAGLTADGIAAAYEVSRAWVYRFDPAPAGNRVARPARPDEISAALSTLWRAIGRRGLTVKTNGTRRRPTPA